MISIVIIGFLVAVIAAAGIAEAWREQAPRKRQQKATSDKFTKSMTERVTFQTSDGVTIVGDWTAPTLRPDVPSGSEVGVPTPSGVGTALLLHMMPATRSSWKGLSEKLAATGIATLAIDLRGHGESVNRTEVLDSARTILVSERSRGATLNYKTFTDADHQASRLDVDAALIWLKEKGYTADRVVVIGASIGANLALDTVARYSEIQKAVMLSGGLDFRGVLTEPAGKKLNPSQRVLLVASADDDYSLQSHRQLAQILGSRATVKEFFAAGHGTTMLGHESKLIDELVAWVVR